MFLEFLIAITNWPRIFQFFAGCMASCASPKTVFSNSSKRRDYSLRSIGECSRTVNDEHDEHDRFFFSGQRGFVPPASARRLGIDEHITVNAVRESGLSPCDETLVGKTELIGTLQSVLAHVVGLERT
jgi:hypothetical protein